MTQLASCSLVGIYTDRQQSLVPPQECSNKHSNPCLCCAREAGACRYRSLLLSAPACRSRENTATPVRARESWIQLFYLKKCAPCLCIRLSNLSTVVPRPVLRTTFSLGVSNTLEPLSSSACTTKKVVVLCVSTISSCLHLRTDMLSICDKQVHTAAGNSFTWLLIKDRECRSPDECNVYLISLGESVQYVQAGPCQHNHLHCLYPRYCMKFNTKNFLRDDC